MTDSLTNDRIKEHLQNILAYQMCNDSAYEGLKGQEKLSVDQSVSAIQSLLANEVKKARIDEWSLISETMHSAGITAELYLNNYRKERLKELEEK